MYHFFWLMGCLYCLSLSSVLDGSLLISVCPIWSGFTIWSVNRCWFRRNLGFEFWALGIPFQLVAADLVVFSFILSFVVVCLICLWLGLLSWWSPACFPASWLFHVMAWPIIIDLVWVSYALFSGLFGWHPVRRLCSSWPTSSSSPDSIGRWCRGGVLLSVGGPRVFIICWCLLAIPHTWVIQRYWWPIVCNPAWVVCSAFPVTWACFPCSHVDLCFAVNSSWCLLASLFCSPAYNLDWMLIPFIFRRAVLFCCNFIWIAFHCWNLVLFCCFCS